MHKPEWIAGCSFTTLLRLMDHTSEVDGFLLHSELCSAHLNSVLRTAQCFLESAVSQAQLIITVTFKQARQITTRVLQNAQEGVIII